MEETGKVLELRWIGHLVAIFVIIVWGTTFVSSKVLLNNGLAPDEIFLCRCILAYVSLLAVSHRKLVCESWKDELIMLGLGMMGGSLYCLAENTALMYDTSSNVSILVGSTPLLTALLIGSVKREMRQTKRQFMGSLIAFVGMALVVLNGQLVLHLNPLGDALALLAALTWAVYSFLITYVNGRYPAHFITRKVFFYGMLTILPVVFGKGATGLTIERLTSPIVMGNILFLGLMASTLCYICWNWVLSVIGTVKTTNYVYLQSAVTLIVASIVLDEKITLMAVMGMLTLIGGMVLALRK